MSCRTPGRLPATSQTPGQNKGGSNREKKFGAGSESLPQGAGVKSYSSGAGRPSQRRKTNKPTCEFPWPPGPPCTPSACANTGEATVGAKPWQSGRRRAAARAPGWHFPCDIPGVTLQSGTLPAQGMGALAGDWECWPGTPGKDFKLPQLGSDPSTSSPKLHPAQSLTPKQFPSQGEVNSGAAWLW